MFSKRTYEEIVNFLIERLSVETDITLTTPGGVARTMMEIISKELATNFNIFDYNFSQAFVSTAGGTALDKFGTLFGLTRKSVDPSVNAESKVVYFYLNDEGVNHDKGVPNFTAEEDIVIPEGTYVSTDIISSNGNPVLWKTVGETRIQQGFYIGYATISPVNNASITISPGSLVNHSLNTESFPNIYVYNKGNIVSTPEVESDENYRFRIINGLRLLASGNQIALRIAALGVVGVRDIQIEPLYYGIGTVRVLVVPEKPGTGDAALAISTVSEVLSSVKSVGDILFVKAPEAIKIDINATLTLDSRFITQYNQNVIINNASNAIRRYINSLNVGENLTVSGIVGAAVKSSNFITDCTILSGSGILVDDIPHDLSTITAGSEEQLYAGNILVN